MNTNQPISPLGQTSQEVAGDDYANDPEYRAIHDRLAPCRVIARAVILERGRRGWTQPQLADRMATSFTAISRIESGRHPITLETLSKLGTALGISFVVGAPAEGGEYVVVPPAAIERATAPPTKKRIAAVAPVAHAVLAQAADNTSR
jgi:Predicted transcription factor, homolog of eukaryotic MBF1